VAELLQSLRQSRRGLVGLAGAALVGVERGTDEVLGAQKKQKVFVFNPEWGAGTKVEHSTTTCPDGKDATHRKGGRCHGCKACHAHAKNKRFATRAAAEQRRAHVGCLCAIESQLVSKKAFVQMFGTPGAPGFSEEFDLRT
jgi:hypothetical protein